MSKTKFHTRVKDDDRLTPFYAWQEVMKVLAPTGTVWCPFYCKGSFVTDHLNTLGIDHVYEDQDFFNWEPAKWDCIIDNPPFSKKAEIVKRCLSLGKPFALLLPFDIMERKWFKGYFNQGIKFHILIPQDRVNFELPEHSTKVFKSKTCIFCSIWLCHGFDITNPIDVPVSYIG